MMQDNIDISEIYDNGSISGETYLYCVEHNIFNIQEAFDLSLDDASELVRSELKEVKLQYQEDVVSIDISPNESLAELEECINDYINLVNSKISISDSELKPQIEKLIEYHGGMNRFIADMLICHGRVDIHNSSSQSISFINYILDIAYELQALKLKYSIFDILFENCHDVRCTNVLKHVYKGYGNKLEFTNWILTCSKEELYKLRNIGERSVDIIWGIIQELQTSKGVIENIPKDGVTEACDKLAIFLISKGYRLSNKLSKDICTYLRDIIWYYGNDLDALYYNILAYQNKKDMPYYKNTSNSILNTVLDIVFDLRSIGKPYNLYDECFNMCRDVRCVNVLKAHYRQYGNKLEFINWLISNSKIDLMKLKNIGRKSWEILWNLVVDLKELEEENKAHEGVEIIPEVIITNTVEEVEHDIDKFRLLIESQRQLLSVRARNVLDNIIGEITYEDLLKQFLSSTFSFANTRNCGRKTEKELNQFKENILSLLMNTTKEEVEEQNVFNKYKSLLGIPDDRVNEIIILQNQLGHFPLLYTIQKYIDSMQHRDHAILHGMLDIYNGQELENRDDLAKQLNLSKERIRQLRGKILQQIGIFIKSIGSNEDLTCYTPGDIENTNQKESTNFQDNFIYWAISLINKEWIIIGDIEDVFFNPHGHQINLNIVPSALGRVYNFKEFISDFDKLYIEKRTVTTEVNLQSLCLNFFRESIQIALMNDIVYECKKIILRLYDCTSNGDIIILDSNAYRGLSEISEEILRDNGSPMTADEIYAVLLERYPNHRCKGANSLVGSINNNPNILPMGRTRTYTLKEWNLGTKRGGTIREFAEECILMQPDRIASLEDIGNYVRQFRETSSNSSIQANLMLEASGKFALYTKEDIKYIGFSGREYPSCYIPAEESMVIVRSFETSTRLLIQFIKDNGRYPFSTGDDVEESEKRLWRFLRNVRYRCKSGTGTPEDYEFIKYLESAFPYQEISRQEYKWRETHKSICETLSRDGWDALNINEQHWCYKYLKLLKDGQLEDWQVPLMIKLKSLYA